MIEQPPVHGLEQQRGVPYPVGQGGAVEDDTLTSGDLRVPVQRQWSAYLDISTYATLASVGSPPSISRAGAPAWTTPSVQARQAYLGRRTTSTRNCAGTTSSDYAC